MRTQIRCARMCALALLLLSVVSSVYASCAGERSDIASDEVSIDAQKFTLGNGLTVVVHADHAAPLVHVNVTYHVGSKNEPIGKSGFAHLFEHLMFNGSDNFNDDFFKATQRIGATSQNGTTSVDRTNYFQTVPKAGSLAIPVELT